MIGHDDWVTQLGAVTHRYGSATALDGVSLELPARTMIGFVGSDGVGKSSLLSIIAGARQIQKGRVYVLDGDMADPAHRASVCPRIAFMPQGLGKNLYPDLSVQENVDFFGRLFSMSRSERRWRIDELLDATGLASFRERAAKNLSGGMRQKLGLCCALIHDPDLLILDEPTTGVDPLARRQFWDLIDRLRAARPQMSVLVATAYMEEAERFDLLVAMERGRVLATGTPADLKARTGCASLEEAFIGLLPEALRVGRKPLHIPPRRIGSSEIAIAARDLSCRFGDFVAVDRVSFAIERGEIFGFVGSNGCGKTTTMKMLTGLLPASGGEAWLFGRPIDSSDMRSRYRVGYMSQSFSLYSELTVRQNLDLHARLFHLPRPMWRERVAKLIRDFGLADHADQLAVRVPLGIRQRLSLAVAIVHEPELLILDEPTSGVDPLARDQFWQLLVGLARDQEVTIFVSTHFMNEAARCDRIALMHAGKVLATGAPATLAAARGLASLEDVFIGYIEEAIGEVGHILTQRTRSRRPAAAPARARERWLSFQRVLAYAHRESLELWRDPVRLSFALLGTVFLMLIFGFGISTDVEHLAFAALDRDQTPESRAYLEELSGSRYFVEQPALADYRDLDRRLQSDAITVAIEIPPGFGQKVRGHRPAELAAWIDGAMPFRAETIRGYLVGVHEHYLADRVATGALHALSPVVVQTRFRYNPSFDSVFAMVPSSIALLLAFIPAVLMALAVVREKELGSIVNLYVTPVTRLEFILGKQIPYVTVGMANFVCLFLMAVLLFGVPLKGSFAALVLGALLYVIATTGYGFVISAFASTQIAALFGTAILTFLPAMQFSGMLMPLSSLTGVGAVMGRGFPMSYFLPVSIGSFTKALGLADLSDSLLGLAAFAPVLTMLALLLLRSQER